MDENHQELMPGYELKVPDRSVEHRKVPPIGWQKQIKDDYIKNITCFLKNKKRR